MWRKNRRPVSNIFCGPDAPHGVGVDLNRNYDDGLPGHHWVWRPANDQPCNTSDDQWATSDNPGSDTYRGPYGSSESEVRALEKLELERPNIKGVIDHHGYGQMILYPWGETHDPVDNVQEYREIGNRMNAALGDANYRVKQSIDLYPTSGTSNDVQHINGILGFTIELGQSFQPGRSQIEPIRQRINRADLTFIDEVLTRRPAPVDPPDVNQERLVDTFRRLGPRPAVAAFRLRLRGRRL